MALNDCRLFDDVAPYIRYADAIADIGPGIRPQPFYRAPRHICVEPHEEYADWLARKGYEVVRRTARAALPHLPRVGVIFMLDVIEHMERADGEACLAMAREKCDQLVVFTPLGFKAQSYAPGDKDAWGLNGTSWQTHRSGWTPRDFDGARIFTDGESFFALFSA